MFLINPYIYGAWTNLKSISFDGVDEYVDLGLVSALSNASNCSVSVWAKDVASTGYPGYWASYEDSDNYITLFWHTVQEQLWIQHYSGTNLATYKSATGLSRTGWHNLILVFTGGAIDSLKCRLYYDGVLAPLTLIGIPNSTTPTITTGQTQISSVNASNYLSGNIDEVGIFDYSLSASEVTAIYNSGCPNNLMSLAAAKRPEHYYRMGDDDTYPTINDIGETGGNDGTMTNQESGDITTDTPC